MYFGPILFISCLLACFVICFPTYKILQIYHIQDIPNHRSSHVVPTVRGGGIAILLTIGLVCTFVPLFCPFRVPLLAVLALIILSVVSFIDDVRGLSAQIRFGTHALAAIALAWSSGLLDSNGLAASSGAKFGVPYPVIVGLMMLWMVGYTSAFNFMDGINGIASFQAGLSALAMVAVASAKMADWYTPSILIALSVSGSAFGFIPHNFPRARMFMGDVGSAPLGLMLAFLVLWICNTQGFDLLIPLVIVNLNFVLDTGITLVRRIARGDRWLEPHREHFYQRLVRSGWSHTAVTTWESVLLFSTAVVSVCVAKAGIPYQIWALVAAILLWLAFFIFADLRFKKYNVLGGAMQ